MSVTRDHLAEHVLDALIDVSGWAEKKGWPREAVLASALETAVNLLAYERGDRRLWLPPWSSWQTPCAAAKASSTGGCSPTSKQPA